MKRTHIDEIIEKLQEQALLIIRKIKVMLIGVPSEIKAQESRIGLNTSKCSEIKLIMVIKFLGTGSMQALGLVLIILIMKKAGAKIVKEASDIFNDAEMISKS